MLHKLIVTVERHDNADVHSQCWSLVQLAAKLETEARLRRTGLIDAEQERYATIKHASIDEHLAAFERDYNSIAALCGRGLGVDGRFPIPDRTVFAGAVKPAEK